MYVAGSGGGDTNAEVDAVTGGGTSGGGFPGVRGCVGSGVGAGAG